MKELEKDISDLTMQMKKFKKRPTMRRLVHIKKVTKLMIGAATAVVTTVVYSKTSPLYVNLDKNDTKSDSKSTDNGETTQSDTSGQKSELR